MRKQIKRLAKIMGARMTSSSPRTGQDEADQRGMDRNRRIALAAGAGVARTAIGLITTIVSTSLILGHFGAERFGLWAVLSGFAGLLAFADLGLGAGLVNAISDAQGRDDDSLVARYVSSAFFLLLGLAALLFIVFVATFKFVNWPGVFNANSSLAIEEAAPAVAVFGILFLVKIPVGLVQRINVGFQEGHVNSAWSVVGNVLALCGLVVVVQVGAGLPMLVAVMLGAPLVALLANAVVLIGRTRRWLLPRRTLVSGSATLRLLRLGSLFFVLQLAMTFSFQLDSLVIAQILGASAVTQYVVPARLFGIVANLTALVLGPMWPAYAEALARSDVAWVESAFRRSFRASALVAIAGGAFFTFFGRFLIDLWVGDVVDASWGLLLGLGAWTAVVGMATPLAMLMNAAHMLRFQIVTAVLMTLANVGLSIVLVQRIGVAGAVWGSVVSHIVTTLIPSWWYVRRFLSTIQ